MTANRILQITIFIVVLVSNLWGNSSKNNPLDSLEFKENENLKVLILDEKMHVLEVIEVNTDETNQLTLKIPKDKKVYVTFIKPQDEESIDSQNPLDEVAQSQLASSLKQESLNQNSTLDDVQTISSAKKTLYEGRFERNKFMGGLLGFEPYKFNYIIPANVSTAKEPNQRKQVETKFQISIKKMLVEDLFMRDLDLYFAYTQQSFWQLYDNYDSRPFRESNYEPSLYLSYFLRDNQWFFDHINFGYLHQSNGGDSTHSRSWDRLFAEGVYSYENFIMTLKTWYRIPENAKQDDNPDIAKYLGYGELSFAYLWDKHLFSATLRNNLRQDNKGAILLDYSYPIYKNLYLYLQFFNGYGESLQDYNNSINRFGIGILFNR